MREGGIEPQRMKGGSEPKGMRSQKPSFGMFVTAGGHLSLQAVSVNAPSYSLWREESMEPETELGPNVTIFWLYGPGKFHDFLDPLSFSL